MFVETFVRGQFVGTGLVRAEAEFKKPTVISRHSNLDIDDILLRVVGHNDARAVFAAFVVESGTWIGPSVSTLTASALIHVVMLNLIKLE